MTPRWVSSSDKHGVPRGDQIYAMVNATYKARVDGERSDGGEVWLHNGFAHAQTEREIEILVIVYPDHREAAVFHAMVLGPKFRKYREDNPDGDR